MPLQATPSLRFFQAVHFPCGAIRFRSVTFHVFTFPKQNFTFLNFSAARPVQALPQQLLSTLCFSHAIHCFFQTILLRVKSMRFLCYSRLFAPFLRPGYAFQLRDWSTLFLCTPLLLFEPRFPCFSPHYGSFAILDISYPFRCPTSQNLSFALRTNRLSRSCCSQASDSLEVCSSHRDNLCSRY